MRTIRRGTTGIIVAALIVAVLVLASSTVYLVFFNPKLSVGNNGGGGSGNNQVVVRVPVSTGSGAATNSGQVTGMDPPANSITVSGAGTVSYTPNEALVGLSVMTINKTAQDSAHSNAEITSRVIRALNGMGISNDSIQTQGYNLYANYNNYNYPATPQIISYTVTNSILVNLTSDNPSQLGLKAGRAIDTGVGAGANQVYLQFSATRALQTRLNTQALQQAVISAASDAKTIADTLGVTISGVISVTEGYSYSPPYYQSFGAGAVAVPATTSNTPVIPGTQTASATVQVVYSIA